MIIVHYSGGEEQELILVKTDGDIISFKTLAEFALWLDMGNTTTLDLAMFDFEKGKVRKCRFI